MTTWIIICILGIANIYTGIFALSAWDVLKYPTWIKFITAAAIFATWTIGAMFILQGLRQCGIYPHKPSEKL